MTCKKQFFKYKYFWYFFLLINLTSCLALNLNPLFSIHKLANNNDISDLNEFGLIDDTNRNKSILFFNFAF